MATIRLKTPTLLSTQCYLQGEWQDADSGHTFDVTNPATGTVIASIPVTVIKYMCMGGIDG
jgi:succinate-semialdehyde dehydrogenase / glutarate-semialdehyde dehydrogenase